MCTLEYRDSLSLSLRGGKLTSQYKEQLKTQLHDKALTNFSTNKRSRVHNEHSTQSSGAPVVPPSKDFPKTDKLRYPKRVSTTEMNKTVRVASATMTRKTGNTF
jgi:hypothetical protein